MEKKLITAIDFGSSMMSIAVAYKDQNGSLELIEYRQRELEGKISDGIIQNPNNILTDINECLQQIEEKHNIKIGAYYWGLEAHTLRSDIKTVSCKPNGNTILDIKHLQEEALHCEIGTGRCYLSADMLSTKLAGDLQGEFNIISVTNRVKTEIEKIINSFSSQRKANFKISPMVEADAFLNQTQKQQGTLLIDFGGGITSFALYKDGMPLSVAVLPLGGIHITQDLAQRFNLSKQTAEDLKIKLGVAATDFIDTDKHYSISSLNKKTEVSLTEITETIEARLCEIIDFIIQEINRQKLKDSYREIVITGGGAKMNFLPELLEKQTSKSVIKLNIDSLQNNSTNTANTLLWALLKMAEEDCSKTVLIKQTNAKNINQQNKPSNKKTGKNFWSRISGMANMFEEDNEKKI